MQEHRIVSVPHDKIVATAMTRMLIGRTTAALKTAQSQQGDANQRLNHEMSKTGCSTSTPRVGRDQSVAFLVDTLQSLAVLSEVSHAEKLLTNALVSVRSEAGSVTDAPQSRVDHTMP
jgi:transcription initiation factor TFIID subunit TAF12